MKTKANILLKLSFLSGAIPFIGGWGIFITWLLGRYLNASDFQSLEMLGFMWMIICFFVAIGGLLILLLYVLINRNNLHKSMLITLLVILINIPSVAIVLEWQKSVARLDFIKIYNNSGIENMRYAIISNNKIKTTAIIDNQKKKVISFKHNYTMFYLALFFDKEVKLIDYSSLPYGSCKYLEIDKDLNIVNKTQQDEAIY